ncbi:MAG: aldehyde dehydrogenase [Subtercola sp.]|nr:aldehyde dehydrogenase [Subtercola sp.]
MQWSGRYDRLFIGGDWVSPSTTNHIEVISPTTEQRLATVPSGARADMEMAVGAARDAFDEGPWPRMPVAERLEVLKRFANLYGAAQETIAQLISSQMGCPITLSRTFQATTPRLILESFIDLAESYPFREVRKSATGAAIVSREPIGVVAAVVPWNAPQNITMQKLAPALITGNTVILKPSPETPLDAYLLAELLQQAGLPDGVLNVVPADREASELLVSHPGVDKVSFTGSTAAGRRIASICGNDLRRVTLELGGKSAAIILDDADLEAAVEQLRFFSLRNSGQVCSLKTRIIVSKRREIELVDRLVDLVESMPVGDPLDEATQIGPMATARQRSVVEGYIEAGRSQGAHVATGGGRPAGLERGWFVEPTVFSGVKPNDRIAQEEIFGPVLSVLSYDTEEEAVAIANNSDYGLNGAVFTADVDRGISLAGRIRTGTVEINGSPAGLSAPMGGFKASGIGRELGAEGMESYVETQSISLPAEVVDRFEAELARSRA